MIESKRFTHWLDSELETFNDSCLEKLQFSQFGDSAKKKTGFLGMFGGGNSDSKKDSAQEKENEDSKELLDFNMASKAEQKKIDDIKSKCNAKVQKVKALSET
jgi:hypothetical protein